ncbi:hypothetical protein Tco_0959328, partial [Tanacetum coccineum]
YGLSGHRPNQESKRVNSWYTSLTSWELGQTLRRFSSLLGTHLFSAADRKKHNPEDDLLLQQGPTRRTSQLPYAQKACICPADVIKAIQAAIELSEYEITFGSRQSIKGKIMVDFLAEVDTPAIVTTGKKSIMHAKPRGYDKETWTLHTDGASTKVSSRAGDEGGGSIKEESMKAYLDQVNQILPYFNSFSITQIPRGMNAYIDALSKLFALNFEHMGKDILVDVIKEKSILQPLEVS